MARIPISPDEQGIRNDDETEGRGTSFSEMTEQAALFGATPQRDEHDPRETWINGSAPLDFDEQLPPHVQAAFDQIGEGIAHVLDAVAPDGYQMADERENVLWGLANVFHSQQTRIAKLIASLTTQVETLENTTAGRIRADGEEMASQELEEKIHQLKSAAAKRDCFETVRDYCGQIYLAQTGKEWAPRAGTHVSQTGDVTPVISGEDFLRARRSTQPVPDMPDGPVIAVTGSTAISDHHAIWYVLDRIRQKHPDMVLVHGAAQGAQKIAGLWAREHNVPQVPLRPDFDQYGKKQAVPKRDDLILQTKPIGIVSFTVDGEKLPRLHTSAIKKGIDPFHIRFDAQGRVRRATPAPDTKQAVTPKQEASQSPAAQTESPAPAPEKASAQMQDGELRPNIKPRPGRTLSGTGGTPVPLQYRNRTLIAVTATIPGPGDNEVRATLDKALEDDPDLVLLHHAHSRDTNDPLGAVAAWADANKVPSLSPEADTAKPDADARIINARPEELIAFLDPSAPKPSLYKAAQTGEQPIPTQHRYNLPAGTVIAIDADRTSCAPEPIHAALDARLEAHPDMVIVHPNMTNDTISHVASWAEKHGVAAIPFTADLDDFGRLAIPLRNQQIIHTEPVELLAFTTPDSNHTPLVKAALDLVPTAAIDVSGPEASHRQAPPGQSYPEPGHDDIQAAAEPRAPAPTPVPPQPDANRAALEKRRLERQADAAVVPQHDLTSVPHDLTQEDASRIEQIEIAVSAVIAYINASYPDDFHLNHYDDLSRREQLFSDCINRVHQELDGPYGLAAKHADLSRQTALLDQGNDGTEIPQAQIEDNAAQLERVNEQIIIQENIRSRLAAEYKNETGHRWTPPASHAERVDTTVNAAAADATNTVEHLRHEHHQARLPAGRAIAITALQHAADRQTVYAHLDKLRQTYPDAFLIHGNATGTLQHVNEWAKERGVEQVHFPPEFSRYPTDALTRRDKLILAQRPVAVLEFGEANSTVLAKLARQDPGIEVETVDPKVHRIIPDQREVSPRQDRVLAPAPAAGAVQARSAGHGGGMSM